VIIGGDGSNPLLSVILETASKDGQHEYREGHANSLRVVCSWEPVLGLLRGFPPSDRLPDACLASPSSGGSDRGLEVLVRGLDGGLLLSSS
jgi:hypothetical protein